MDAKKAGEGVITTDLVAAEEVVVKADPGVALDELKVPGSSSPVDLDEVYDAASEQIHTEGGDHAFALLMAKFSDDPMGALQELISEGSDAVTANAMVLSASVQQSDAWKNGSATVEGLFAQLMSSDAMTAAMGYVEELGENPLVADPMQALDLAIAQGEELTGEAKVKFDALLATIQSGTGDLLTKFREDPNWMTPGDALGIAIEQSNNS